MATIRGDLASSMNVAFVYDAGLPAQWVIGIQTFKKKLHDAGVLAFVISVPVEELSPDAEVVLATRPCTEAVKRRAPRARLVILDTFARQPGYDGLVAELATLSAANPEGDDPHRPVIVTYRGDQRID